MKKFYFVLSFLFVLIPSYLFSIEKMVDEMHTNYVNGNIIGVKVLYEQIDNSAWDDASKAIAKTYYLMAKAVLAERVDIEDIDSNIKDIENLLGVDNKYYAYAIYCKSQTNPDDMSLVENGCQLIKNSCGEDSWEYGVAVCNYAVAVGNNTRDYKKTVSILNNGISIIEKVNPNSWFLPIAFSNKAMYMLLLGDSGCFEELNKAEKSVFALPDDNSFVPLITLSYTYLTIMGALPDSDFKELRSYGISVLETFDEEIYKENELYCALLQSVATVCYKVGDKKDCLKYMDEAVSIIEGIYGRDNSKYNSFVKNRSYFANN